MDNLPPDLLEKAKRWEAESYPAQQLKALQDVRDELTKLSTFLSTSQADDKKSDERVVETVQSMLKALNILGDQKSFNADFAQPVVAALDKLQGSLAEAIKGIEVKTPAPVVNVKAPDVPALKLDKLPAPVVNVEAPQVNLDLSGVQKVLRTDIPKAFNQAISQIPESQPTDMAPVLEAISGLMPLLEEINTGVRLKPLPPSTMKITNQDGSEFIARHAQRSLLGTQQTSISSSTAETTIVTADGTYKLDLYGLVLTNTSATATKVTIKDYTGGVTRLVFQVPAGDTRGFMLPASDGHPQNASNSNWTATCSASVATLEVTALFAKSL